MFSLQGNLIFITIDQAYLKYLHDFCGEVHYKPAGYENKPYIGILLGKDGAQYAIPLSSAKEKHRSWRNIEADRLLIYENCQKDVLSHKAVYTENADGTVKHILSVIDLKKMIPIKDGLYKKVDLTGNPADSAEARNYKNLMNKEYSFCLKILGSVLQKAGKLYGKQRTTGKIIKFCCDFALLEEKCDAYTI